jgi:hypothetical protein
MVWDKKKLDDLFYIDGNLMNVRRTKEEIVELDVFLSGCELDCLFVVGWCVFEIGDVA